MHLHSLVCELHRTQVPLLDLALRKAGMRDGAPFRAVYHFRHQTRCAQVLEEAQRIHAAEHAHRSLVNACLASFICRRPTSKPRASRASGEQRLKWSATSGAVGGVPEAARRVPGVQRCRWKARRLRMLLVCMLHLMQAS